MKIQFNRPYMTGNELDNITQAKLGHMLAGDGPFTKRCHEWIEARTNCAKALLTHSCTAALEMTALLLDLGPGDEVIMPSYTFVSTANAFVLRGCKPVFVDIRTDTLNIDENLIEDAITSRTKAIVVVHYAGVGCEMDTVLQIARKHGLKVIEDAAQGVMATYKNRALGAIGDMGTFSFHETKNVISGEGGALLVNKPDLVSRAEVIREKGTDRSRFFRGEIDKYTWQDVGSSFLPGELISAFLWAQLQEAESITSCRLESWNYYHKLINPLEEKGQLRRPIVPDHCGQNAHLYYVLLPWGVPREKILSYMKEHQVFALFHYVPLHSSPAGQKYSRVCGSMKNTEELSERLIRLPLWSGISMEQQDRVVHILERAIGTYL
jgi:dTDP-4-amino-4,6-dideoxygalactose transaminase